MPSVSVGRGSQKGGGPNRPGSSPDTSPSKTKKRTLRDVTQNVRLAQRLARSRSLSPSPADPDESERERKRKTFREVTRGVRLAQRLARRSGSVSQSRGRDPRASASGSGSGIAIKSRATRGSRVSLLREDSSDEFSDCDESVGAPEASIGRKAGGSGGTVKNPMRKRVSRNRNFSSSSRSTGPSSAENRSAAATSRDRRFGYESGGIGKSSGEDSDFASAEESSGGGHSWSERDDSSDDSERGFSESRSRDSFASSRRNVSARAREAAREASRAGRGKLSSNLKRPVSSEATNARRSWSEREQREQREEVFDSEGFTSVSRSWSAQGSARARLDFGFEVASDISDEDEDDVVATRGFSGESRRNFLGGGFSGTRATRLWRGEKGKSTEPPPIAKHHHAHRFHAHGHYAAAHHQGGLTQPPLSQQRTAYWFQIVTANHPLVAETLRFLKRSLSNPWTYLYVLLLYLSTAFCRSVWVCRVTADEVCVPNLCGCCMRSCSLISRVLGRSTWCCCGNELCAPSYGEDEWSVLSNPQRALRQRGVIHSEFVVWVEAGLNAKLAEAYWGHRFGLAACANSQRGWVPLLGVCTATCCPCCESRASQGPGAGSGEPEATDSTDSGAASGGSTACCCCSSSSRGGGGESTREEPTCCSRVLSVLTCCWCRACTSCCRRGAKEQRRAARAGTSLSSSERNERNRSSTESGGASTTFVGGGRARAAAVVWPYLRHLFVRRYLHLLHMLREDDSKYLSESSSDDRGEQRGSSGGQNNALENALRTPGVFNYCPRSAVSPWAEGETRGVERVVSAFRNMVSGRDADVKSFRTLMYLLDDEPGQFLHVFFLKRNLSAYYCNRRGFRIEIVSIVLVIGGRCWVDSFLDVYCSSIIKLFTRVFTRAL